MDIQANTETILQLQINGLGSKSSHLGHLMGTWNDCIYKNIVRI